MTQRGYKKFNCEFRKDSILMQWQYVGIYWVPTYIVSRTNIAFDILLLARGSSSIIRVYWYVAYEDSKIP